MHRPICSANPRRPWRDAWKPCSWKAFAWGTWAVAPKAGYWLRGGFPLAYTARSEGDSVAWRRQFLQTFLERDIPQLGIQIPAVALRRFWNMLAHYHAQTWNGAELARALAVSESTVAAISIS